MTPAEIYDAFEAHVKEIKGNNFFGSSRFNAEHSSLRNLFRDLNRQLVAHMATPLNRDTEIAALRRRSPKDHRKYLPAVNELCRTWPTGDYHTVHIISPPMDMITPPRAVEPRAMTTARADAELWERIEVTDLPTGTSGQYTHTENDKKTTTQKGTASGQVLALKLDNVDASNVIERPEYWVSLGRLVFASNAARCFGCAAAVIYTYCYENRFPNLWLEVVGSAGYDHHFVVVGRENEDIRDVDNWGHGAFVIDVWHSNLNSQRTPATLRPQDCQYVRDGSRLKAFCSISPEWRSYLHDYALRLGTFPKDRRVAEMAQPVITETTQNTVPTVSTVQNNRPVNPLLGELQGRFAQRNVA